MTSSTGHYPSRKFWHQRNFKNFLETIHSWQCDSNAEWPMRFSEMLKSKHMVTAEIGWTTRPIFEHFPAILLANNFITWPFSKPGGPLLFFCYLKWKFCCLKWRFHCWWRHMLSGPPDYHHQREVGLPCQFLEFGKKCPNFDALRSSMG